jgi:branched-chain amino acid transport system ATP-binding protein
LLRLENITKRFGGLVASKKVNIKVDKGEIVGLIGPNGAGKTTLFNMISGTFPPTEGKIIYDGTDITGWPSNKVFKAGIARTFQVVKPFNSLNCLENVLVAVKAKFGSDKKHEEKAFSALKYLGMEHRAYVEASSLTLAEKRKLELARAIASDPKILMLDEVMAGLNPSELDEILGLIKSLQKDKEITIIAVEHVMKVIMTLSNRIYVLNYGEIIANGSPQEVSSNESVIKAYLGDDADVAG